MLIQRKEVIGGFVYLSQSTGYKNEPYQQAHMGLTNSESINKIGEIDIKITKKFKTEIEKQTCVKLHQPRPL
jgi:hypothetical protein